ncbi:hypothetical protein HDV01_006573 [Terramyces sp. JEL0728]|nr:hypothetical protein HDV01_006573 [Terramyces sp. JEL0728]
MTKAKRKRVKQAVKEYNIKGQQLYCICRQTDDGLFMIQCDDCKEWYHGNCVDVKEETAPENYSCTLCIQLANNSAELESLDVGGAVTPTLQSPEIVEPAQKKIKIKVNDKVDKTDKLRKLAKKGFQDTFKLLFQQLKEHPDFLDLPLDSSIDLDAPLSFAQDLEEALFAQYSIETQYDCIASDQDPKNKRLKRRMFCLKESMERIVSLSPEDMANDDLVMKAEEIARESLHMAYKPSKEPEKKKEKSHNDSLDLPKVKSENGSAYSIAPTTSTLPAATPAVSNKVKAAFAPIVSKVKPVVPQKMQRDSLDSLLERMTTPIYKPKVEPTPISESNQTISGSESTQLSEREEKGKSVWKGSIKMPQVTEVEVNASQIAGNPLSSSKWRDLLPSNLLVGGRIPVDKTMTYLNQRIQQRADISILQLHTKDSNHFQKLAGYLVQKERYGVIADPLPGIKDLYLIPIKRRGTHSLFTDLKCRYKINNEKDCLVLVAVMSNGPVKEKKVRKEPVTYQPNPTTLPIPSGLPFNNMSVPPSVSQQNIPPGYPQMVYPPMNNFNPPFNMNPGLNPTLPPQYPNPNFNINPQSFQGLLDGLGLQSQQIGGLLADLLAKQNN